MLEPLPNEPELLDRCAKGDAGAFGQLVTHYENTIFNLVFRMIGRREDARDVTQEVFVKAFRKIGSFEGRSSFATWLYSIAVNRSLSERRRLATTLRRNEVQMSALGNEEAGSPYDPPGNELAPDARLRSDETRRQVEQAVATLDDDHRAVVVLRDIEGLDYESIGTVLGCSKGTVRSRLHRARVELREKLRPLLAR